MSNPGDESLPAGSVMDSPKRSFPLVRINASSGDPETVDEDAHLRQALSSTTKRRDRKTLLLA